VRANQILPVDSEAADRQPRAELKASEKHFCPQEIQSDLVGLSNFFSAQELK
jgi:hypothetical protein